MRARTPKRAAQERRYRILRADFLSNRPWCESPLRCGRAAVEVHHQQGRIGALLTDTTNWMALCSECHRYYTDHPAEAIAAGVSKSRVGIEVHDFTPDPGGAYCLHCGLPPANRRHQEAS